MKDKQAKKKIKIQKRMKAQMSRAQIAQIEE